jgi:hypothetical protein
MVQEKINAVRVRRANLRKQNTNATLMLTVIYSWFLFVSLQCAFGHTIQIEASAKECFFEDLHVNDKVLLEASMFSGMLKHPP